MGMLTAYWGDSRQPFQSLQMRKLALLPESKVTNELTDAVGFSSQGSKNSMGVS